MADLTMAEAVEFATRLRLRPGYFVEVEPSGLVYTGATGPNAYRPEDVRRWWWSYRLREEDLVSEAKLLRRLIFGLVEFDLHEHMEFSGLVDPHRDPNGVEITSWPHDLREPCRG